MQYVLFARPSTMPLRVTSSVTPSPSRSTTSRGTPPTVGAVPLPQAGGTGSREPRVHVGVRGERGADSPGDRRGRTGDRRDQIDGPVGVDVTEHRRRDEGRRQRDCLERVEVRPPHVNRGRAGGTDRDLLALPERARIDVPGRHGSRDGGLGIAVVVGAPRTASDEIEPAQPAGLGQQRVRNDLPLSSRTVTSAVSGGACLIARRGLVDVERAQREHRSRRVALPADDAVDAATHRWPQHLDDAVAVESAAASMSAPKVVVIEYPTSRFAAVIVPTCPSPPPITSLAASPSRSPARSVVVGKRVSSEVAGSNVPVPCRQRPSMPQPHPAGQATTAACRCTRTRTARTRGSTHPVRVPTHPRDWRTRRSPRRPRRRGCRRSPAGPPAGWCRPPGR